MESIFVGVNFALGSFSGSAFFIRLHTIPFVLLFFSTEDPQMATANPLVNKLGVLEAMMIFQVASEIDTPFPIST